MSFKYTIEQLQSPDFPRIEINGRDQLSAFFKFTAGLVSPSALDSEPRSFDRLPNILDLLRPRGLNATMQDGFSISTITNPLETLVLADAGEALSDAGWLSDRPRGLSKRNIVSDRLKSSLGFWVDGVIGCDDRARDFTTAIFQLPPSATTSSGEPPVRTFAAVPKEVLEKVKRGNANSAISSSTYYKKPRAYRSNRTGRSAGSLTSYQN